MTSVFPPTQAAQPSFAVLHPMEGLQKLATSATDRTPNCLNIALTQFLPLMDVAHQRLVNLEDTAYRCLSREEARRIIQEADALSQDLHPESGSVTPLRHPGRAA